MRLPEMALQLRNKSSNSLIYDVVRFCIKASAVAIKMADHVKKTGTSAKGNASKIIRGSSYKSYFQDYGD
jgi:hypothetical protein